MTILDDVHYALRMWRRHPGFIAAAVLTLALGIGANTTMFSVVNATLLRDLPFPDPGRLMTIWKGRVDNPDSMNINSWPNVQDLEDRARAFERIGMFDSAGRGYNLGGDTEPEQVSGVRVTASFFEVLGVPPLLGRTFVEDEETPGRDAVVVLSHGLWTRRYGADPSIVGKSIAIDNRPHTVIGVMPPQFQFQFWSGQRELWVPAGWTEGDRERGSNSFITIARLREGVTEAQAQSELDAIGRRLADEYPNENAGWTVRLVSMREFGMQDISRSLLAILGVVGFVLLIACANVANLTLARAASRHRELAVRRALGASRRRIVRQLLTESVLLALAGGAAGILIGVWGTSLLTTILPNTLRFLPLRPMESIELDGAVLAFTAGVACASGILFGLVPALVASRVDLQETMKEGARGSTAGGKGRLRYSLVAAEVALTVVTVAGAGMMIVSVARLLRVDPGLDTSNVLVMQMSLPQANLYYGPPDHPRFCQALDEQAGQVPGVVSVSAIAHLPLSGANAGRGVGVEGQPDPGPGNRPGAGYTVACPNSLRTLGVPILAGRDFTHQDAAGATGVALINENMAQRFWPDEDPIGKRFKPGSVDADLPWLTVVGVFKDFRHGGLATEAGSRFMRPYTQAGWPIMSIVARTSAAPETFVTPVKQALAIIEPTQPVTGIRTMDQVAQTSISSRRFPMLLLSGFAVLALVLAAVGIAGVVGYSVVQRTQEIGVRMALGARPRDVLRLVVGHSLMWSVAGVAAGVIASYFLLGALRSMLFEVTPTDPMVLAGVSALLLLVALAATGIPARRAARIDPVIALRAE